MRKRIRNGLIGGLLLCTTAVLAGCANPPTHDTPTSTVSHVAPIVVDLSTLDGQTVTVPRSTVLDITVPPGESVGWTATFGTHGIGLFQPGSNRGDLATNPGILPLRTGTTTVTLESKAGHRKCTFTLNVVAAPGD